ncbi:MAG: CHAT domain-containing tetratricopeptide repeat protein, partial [Bacteroidota bacterium]
LNNLAYVYTQVYDFEKALDVYQDAFQVMSRELPPDHPNLATVYNGWGSSLSNLGFHTKALPFIQKSIEIRRKQLGPNHPYIANSINNLATVYQTAGKYDRAIELVKESLAIRQSSKDPSWVEIATHYRNLAVFHFEKGSMDSVLLYLDRSTQLRRQYLVYPNIRIGENENFYALYYLKKKEYRKSLAWAEKAIKTFLASKGTFWWISRTYSYKSQILEHYGQLDSAIYYAQKSLQVIDPSLPLDDIDAQPTIETIFLSGRGIVQLKLKAELLTRLSENGKPEYLHSALKSIQTAIEALDKMRIEFTEPDREQLSATSLPAYEIAIDICQKLYQQTGDLQYIQLAFSYSEKSKSLVLKELTNQHTALEFAGIPAELRELERSLRNRLSYYYRSLAAKNDRSPALSAKRELWQNRLMQLNTRYDSLRRQLFIHYPRYYELTYKLEQPAVGDIQQKLAPDQSMIEYFVGDKNVYAFVLDRNEISLHKLGEPDKIKQDMNAFREHFSTEFIEDLFTNPNQRDAQRAFQNYHQHGYAIYQALLDPLIERLPAEQKITLIPDDFLSYIAFEALPMQPRAETTVDYRNVPYLIKSHQISYLSSAFFQEQEKRPATGFSIPYLGFAPEYTAEWEGRILSIRGNIKANLPFAQQEVREAASLLGGRYYVGDQATKSTFLEEAGRSQIIHLAMHTDLQDEEPIYSEMNFSEADGSSRPGLSILEVYGLEIPAQLAVLSGCETGLGKVARGEGLISLSRAFQYAGCRSILLSLWDVEDRSSYEVLGGFFAALQASQTKATALRNAKKQYIETVGDPAFAHPFFWAPFIMIGEDDAIQASSETPTNWGAWILVACALLFILLYAYLSRRSPR